MSTEPLYLKPNVRIEGLVNQFVAWTHVYTPVSGAMNLANLLLPIMDSYVQRPDVHLAAVANPKMRGGFFINAEASRVDEVRDLRDRIVRDESAAIAFAAAVKNAEDLLRAQATGYDLSPLYAQLPPELRGYVELVYDLNHQPTLRFLEPLLYRSAVHRREREAIELSLDDGSEPPFILSTPRLARDGHLQLPLPLDHTGIDELFALRSTPQPLEQVAKALEITGAEQEATLRALLTTESTLAPDRHIDSGGRIRYFGHACLLLQSPSTSILVDPFISSNPAAGDRFTYVDLPDRIDYCLITHAHQDHVVLETLLQLRHKIGTVVVPRNGGGQRQDPSIRHYLERVGMTVREVDDLDELPFDGGTIVSAPFFGEHCDLDIRAKSSYWVNIAGRSVFVGADTSGLESHLYTRIREAVGPTDVAFIGMECDGAPLTWLYSALFTQPVPRKMALTRKLSGSNAAQATGILKQLGAREAYVYAMGQEDWLQHVMATSYTPESYQLLQVAEFLDTCRRDGVHAEHLLVRKEMRW
ncbi:MBL fold metallo-hydrolase [Micromonospora sp. NPDC000207]|uniref:MBL fold metallo-hydrolase n=1 Tax=Micromonospora sp. NPDC000207 TaxID=3154246 RepID=UPI003324E060